MRVFDLGKDDPVWKVYEGLAAESLRKNLEAGKGSRRLRASEAADCSRRIWYRVGGFQPLPKQPWLELVSDSGNMHHEYARTIGNHFGMEITGFTTVDGVQEEEHYSSKIFKYDGQEFELSCRPDGYVTLTEGRKAVLEIKSMSQFAYQKAESAFKKGPEALLALLQHEHPNYLWQGNVTAMIRELDHVYLLCVGRSGNNFGFGAVGPDKPGVWDPLRGRRAGGLVWQLEDRDRENILAKLADVSRRLATGEAPPPDYSPGSSECGMCPFLYACPNGQMLNVKYPSNAIWGDMEGSS